MALLSPGDGCCLCRSSREGITSHGLKPNFSGTFFEIHEYDVDADTEQLDYDVIETIAREVQPKLIICGYSAYPRIIDFQRFRSIADSVARS